MSVSRQDMLLVIDAVAREKNIDREEVFQAMEQAMEKAGRSRYGTEQDIRAIIDRETGSISLCRYREITEEVENDALQISLNQARNLKEDAAPGAFIIDPLPPLDFSRIAAQAARQIIVHQVREAERDQQYNEYKDRVGEIISGIVKRIEYGHVIVDLGRGEGIIRRDELIPREHFRHGDRVTCYLYSVRRENRGPQIFLSRTHPQFMIRLFEQEVPEIHDGAIEILNCARDPGSRAKISVFSKDPTVDPVGACVGMRGGRVQAVVSELQGEKIDIIPWSEDLATHVVNALAPAEVSKVVLDEDRNIIEIIVPEDQLSQAIGRRGQNVRLASMLTRTEIDIMSEAQESERRQTEINRCSELFIESLNVDDVIARLLATEGFSSVEDIVEAGTEQLSAIQGFDDAIAGELVDRAGKAIETQEAERQKKLDQLDVEDGLRNLHGLTSKMLLALAEQNIHKMRHFADCSADELTDRKEGLLRDFRVDTLVASEWILRVRAALGWIEEKDAEEAIRKLYTPEEEPLAEEAAQADEMENPAESGAENVALTEPAQSETISASR